MHSISVLFICLIATVVVAGFLLLRGAAPVPSNRLAQRAAVESCDQSHRDCRRGNTDGNDGGATLWIGALEAGMALVLVLATLAITDAATSSRPDSRSAAQVLVNATPDVADQQPSPASATTGNALVRPTHRLVALDSTAADASAVIIELDSPLPPDRPVKFLINTSTAPNPQ